MGAFFIPALITYKENYFVLPPPLKGRRKTKTPLEAGVEMINKAAPIKCGFIKEKL